MGTASEGEGRQLGESAVRKAPEVGAALEKQEFRAALKAIVELSTGANQFLQSRAPWNAVKTQPEVAKRDLSDAAEIVYLLAGLLEPVVPALAQKLFLQLQAPRLTYEALGSSRYPLLDREKLIGT